MCTLFFFFHRGSLTFKVVIGINDMGLYHDISLANFSSLFCILKPIRRGEWEVDVHLSTTLARRELPTLVWSDFLMRTGKKKDLDTCRIACN